MKAAIANDSPVSLAPMDQCFNKYKGKQTSVGKWSRYELGLLWTLILTVNLIIAGLKQPYVTQIWNIINKYVYNGSNKLLAPINWDVNDEGSKLKLLTDRIKSVGDVTMAIFT